MITKNIAKFVIAVAFVLATITSAGIVSEQVGFDITPSVYAGPCSTNGGGRLLKSSSSSDTIYIP